MTVFGRDLLSCEDVEPTRRPPARHGGELIDLPMWGLGIVLLVAFLMGLLGLLVTRPWRRRRR